MIKRHVRKSWIPGRQKHNDFRRRIAEAIEPVTAMDIARCCRQARQAEYMYMDPRMDNVRARLALQKYSGHRVAFCQRDLALIASLITNPDAYYAYVFVCQPQNLLR